MKTTIVSTLGLAVAACTSSPAGPPAQAPMPITNTTPSTVVLTSEVEWQKLNPARGDESPKAGTLWGDRNGREATGFLFNPVDGFTSPPHIHNVSYRGIVIRGLVHNDDPSADEMWMPAGSFWTQPKGAVHITAATGKDTLAYIEIDEGPYLVHPVGQAFASEEKSVNVDASNIGWIDVPEVSSTENSIKVATLWGDPESLELSGSLVKIPDGYEGGIRSDSSTLRAVVIQGRLKYNVSGLTNDKTLMPGSYFSSEGESVHEVSCEAEKECVLYLRTKGAFDLTKDGL